MDSNELKSLITQGKRDEAIKLAKDFYGVSLKEADEYVELLMSKNNLDKKRKNKKSNIWKTVLIAIPIILIGIILIGQYSVYQYWEEQSQMYESFHKDAYGPKDYKEAYLKIAHDTLLKAEEKSDLYIELRKEEISGTPFKKTKYWKNYKLK
jgi:hypothetical protein